MKSGTVLGVMSGPLSPLRPGYDHIDLTAAAASRICILRDILAKLRPEPAGEPLPPLKVYAPPRATAARRPRAGR